MELFDKLILKAGTILESDLDRKQTLGDLFGNLSDNKIKQLKMNSGNGTSQFEKNSDASKDTIVNILTKRSHIYKKLIEFCNITGGVGTDAHSDDKVENAGAASDELINSKLEKLKSETNQLIKYEDEVVKFENPSGRKLLKVLNSIDTDLLDWDTKETPRITQSLKEPIYAYSFKKNGKNLERVSRPTLIGPGTMKIGKPRYNADIFEDLYPFIIEFADPRRNVSMKALLKGVIDSEKFDDNKMLKKAMGEFQDKTGIKDDFLSDHGKKAPKTKQETPDEEKARLNNRNLRKKVMDKAIDAGDYEEARSNEKTYDAGKGSNTGGYSRMMANKKTHELAVKYGLEKAAPKQKLSEAPKVQNTGAESTGTAPSLKGTTLKKAATILTAFEEKFPGKQAGIYVGSVTSGTGQQVFLLSKEFIEFSKTKTHDIEPIQGQACVNGHYIYMLPHATKIHKEHPNSIKNISGKGVESELKSKVKKAIGAASIVSEENSRYFNY